MKKSIYYYVAILLLLSSCVPSESYLHFIFDISDNFRAVISIKTDDDDDDYWCRISSNEEITILAQDAESRVATVEEVCDYGEDAICALYPADAGATLYGNKIITSLPSVSHYGEHIDAIMIANGDDDNLKFMDVTSTLSINIGVNSDQTHTLKSLTLISEERAIAGEMEINLADGKISVSDAGSNRISIVDINMPIMTELQSFAMAVPSYSFADGQLSIIAEFEDMTHRVVLPAVEFQPGVTCCVNHIF